MSFKAASSHQNRFVVKAKISVPWNSAIEDDSVMDGNVRAKDSIAGHEEQENTQFCIRGRKNQPQKINEFCLDK